MLFGTFEHSSTKKVNHYSSPLSVYFCRSANTDDILVILGQDKFASAEDPGEVAFQVEKVWVHEKFQ